MDYLAGVIFKSVEAAVSYGAKMNVGKWLLGSKTSPERLRSDTNKKECKEYVKLEGKNIFEVTC